MQRGGLENESVTKINIMSDDCAYNVILFNVLLFCGRDILFLVIELQINSENFS